MNTQFRAHLTLNHQLQECDKLLKETQFKLGEMTSYTQELEDENKKLKQEYLKLKARYNNDCTELNKELRESELIKSLVSDRDRWKRLHKQALDARDSAIIQLNKLKEKYDNV